ncbi:PAP/25A associated domain protein [Dictyocaulus viviparus]|uniref:PAP/25A associated domain protein n=1 Tax=Dictyocaulus viviparus TaxID=29172 RepID=A0A0D8X918_DICVI|nr:PAP/25A associated domain protein [Dictyocaulus viviparus]
MNRDMVNKNLRRKNRRYEQKKNDISPRGRFAFIHKIAKKWGKELRIRRTCDPTGGKLDVVCLNGTEQFTVHIAFGDIPYVVLGAKGIGRTAEEADSNSAWNLMSFFQGYLSRSTMTRLRRNWANADDEINEAVEVCRMIEQTMNSEQFCQLRMVPVLDINPPEKAWARQVRIELRKMFAENRLCNSATTSASPYTGTVFAEQHEWKLKRKPSFGSEDIYDDDGCSSNKRNRSCQVDSFKGAIQFSGDDYDEDGLHITVSEYLCIVFLQASSCASVICLEQDIDDVENDMQSFSKQLGNAQPSLNIGISPFSSSSTSAPISGGKCQELPLFYEKDLIGVQFNAAASPIADKVREYREKYPSEFTAFDDQIWRHYESNRQTEEVYEWKMEVRNILLTEFRAAFPNQNIELFAVGSTVNGCGSYNSDMDLCLCVPMGVGKIYSSERMAAVKILRRLNNIIKGKPSLRRVVRLSEVIPAKVPIIKMSLHPPYEELDLDINVNNTAGIYNSHLIHYYSLLDPRFPAVCLLVKHWAITNGIGDAATGSFNSYSLILLVLHYFQCGVQPAVLPNLQYLYPEKFGSTPPLSELQLFRTLQYLPSRAPNKQTVGELLVGFFYYYSSFDFENVAISMRDACVFPRSEMTPNTAIYRVFIEEPFDRHNTARCVTKSYVMDRISRTFRHAKDAFSRFPPCLQRIKTFAKRPDH